jgi:hypothetical protein
MNTHVQNLRHAAAALDRGLLVHPGNIRAAADAMQDALTRVDMLTQERLELLREIATLRAWEGM